MNETEPKSVKPPEQGLPAEQKSDNCPICCSPVVAREFAAGWGCDRKPICTNHDCPSNQAKNTIGWGQ